MRDFNERFEKITNLFKLLDTIQKIEDYSYGRDYELRLFDDGNLYASYFNDEDNSDDVEIGKINKTEYLQIKMLLQTHCNVSALKECLVGYTSNSVSTTHSRPTPVLQHKT